MRTSGRVMRTSRLSRVERAVADLPEGIDLQGAELVECLDHKNQLLPRYLRPLIVVSISSEVVTIFRQKL